MLRQALCRFFGKKFRKSANSSDICPMKFLVIQTAFIGDVILATALVEKIHRHYPDASIDFLLRKGNESLLKGHPSISQTIIWDKKGGKYTNLLRILQQIRRKQYDVVINCQRFAASGLLTAFSAAKEKLGFQKNPFSFLFSKAFPHIIGEGPSRFGLPYIHEVDRNLSLIEHLTDRLPEKPKLYPSDTDYGRAREIASGSTYVCMAPTSVWFTKQWPAEKWAALIHKIPAGITIFLLGGPDDATACAHIQQLAGREQVVNLAGTISLITSAALMRDAAMNYVNDSAPLHLATAVDAPVTAIFCSTIPAFGFTPLSTNSTVAETTLPLSCRPCGLHGYRTCPKGHFRCAEIVITTTRDLNP